MRRRATPARKNEPTEGNPALISATMTSLARFSYLTRNRLLGVLGYPLAAVLAFLLLGYQRIAIWPAPSRVIPFTDSANGGHSTASVDTSGRSIHIAIQLDTGTQYPVAGGILFAGSDSAPLDLSATGEIVLDVGTSSLPVLRVCLVEDLPGFTRNEAWQTARYECSDIELLPGTSRYRIPLAEFATPPWWYATADLRPSQLGPEKRQRIVRVVFQCGDTTPLHQPFDVRIHALQARLARLWIWALCLLFGIGVPLAHAFSWKRSARTPASPLAGARVQFQPVHAVSYADRERDAVLELIGSEYVNADLSLERVARASGVPIDRVTSHIKTASGLLFKAYLNKVRGEAARKLLLETDLPVSEIALRVGYGSVPHFNRVFKDLYDTTPTAVRGTPSTDESVAHPDPSDS